jgi:endonuclease/exonuclease/phosphatase (EEP) superfamily protein YafD
VAGDFNDTPISYTYRKMRRGLNDAFVEAGYGAGFTYKGKYPPNRIDYVLYTDELECVDFDIVKVRYSDHYPIITYFRKAD